MPLKVAIPIVAGIGNALMAVPMARQLRQGRPDAEITILARNGAMAEVFRRLPEVRDVVVTGGGPGGILRTVNAARALRPDVYLVPFPSNRWQYSMLAATSGAARRILHGYPVGRFRALHFLPSTRVPARRRIHDVAQNLELLRTLDLTPDLNDAPTFALNDTDHAHAAELLQRSAYTSIDAPVIVHAGSAQTVLARAKRWPAERYAKLITALDERWPGRVVLVEGPDESGVADEIRRASNDNLPATIVKLTGPLGDAAALLARAALYVGSDSGLAHLAAAVGTTPVTIFGPADPDRVCPFGYRDLVVQSSRSCGPCFTYPWQTPYPKINCKPPFCIEAITVERVLEKVDLARARVEPDADASIAPQRRLGRGCIG
jgi:ADP-heptose:LPS heptosyltransferase